MSKKIIPIEEIKHINHGLVAKPHTPMYLIHKFWARKPHNVVREYIERYSKPNEIVLDPFVGSGVTAIEALKAGRKTVALDLNPISNHIIKNTLPSCDLKKFNDEFDKLENELEDKINEMYITGCKRCGKKAIILATIWEKEKEAPKELRYFCSYCKKRMTKTPDEEDIKKLKSIEKATIPYWYPRTKLYYNHEPFMKKEKSNSIPDLFTKRNIIALSILFHEVEGIKDKKLRELMMFAFTSMVHLASKMCPVAKPSERAHWSELSATSFWPLHSYWIPPTFMESNVWMLFKSAINGKQGVIKGKTESNNLIQELNYADEFDDLRNDANIFLKTNDVLELNKIVPINSVDYIFTDPPYGGSVQYFELSTLWASWLKMDLNYTEEITVNKQQHKDFDYYHKMLKAAFREMYTVLKPGKYLTVTFHSIDIGVWNSIIKAVVMSGFDLEKIIYQPPARASAKGLLQPYGSAVGDYYIRFRKPEIEKLVTEKQMDLESYEREVVFAAKGILEHRGEPTIYQHILNGIMVDLKGGRFAPIGARNIEDILKDHVEKEFELIKVRNEDGKVIGKKWWLKGRDFSNFTTPALGDRIERVILNVLDKKIKASFDDILQSIFIEFPNSLTPDSQDIRKILEEYAKPTADGKWMLKAGLSEKERESIHNEMIFILATLGKKAGYDVWIGSKEQGAIFNKKPLKELCDNISVFKFIPQETLALERIKQIDTLWLEDGRIKYEFEVENTTGISEAIIRGSNIPSELEPKRFIVIPNERENFLFKKLQEPILRETINKIKWDFIRYDELKIIFKQSKKKFDPVELEKISRLPKAKNDIQRNLSDF